MTATAKLLLATLLLATGGALMIAGARLTWVTIATPGERVRLPGGTAMVGAHVDREPGSEFVPALLPLGIVVVALAITAVLLGPGPRTAALALAGVFAALAIGLVVAERDPTSAVVVPADGGTPVTSRAGGYVVALAGCCASFVAAAVALRWARRAPRFGLPEGAPE